MSCFEPLAFPLAGVSRGQKKAQTFPFKNPCGPQKPLFCSILRHDCISLKLDIEISLNNIHCNFFIPRCGLCVINSWQLTFRFVRGNLAENPIFEGFGDLSGRHEIGPTWLQTMSICTGFFLIVWVLFWPKHGSKLLSLVVLLEPGMSQAPIVEGFSVPPKLPFLCMFWGQQTGPFSHYTHPSQTL